LQNANGDWVKPTVAGVLKAFGSIQPPQSDSNGNYCASCLNWGLRTDPTAWVEALDPQEPLANPSGSGSYPLVGTTNFLGYTCYASSSRVGTLAGQLGYVETATINTSTQGVLGLSGLAPLPKQPDPARQPVSSAADRLSLTRTRGPGFRGRFFSAFPFARARRHCAGDRREPALPR
jgi:hypothetical protein